MSEEAPAPGEVWRLLNKIDKRLDEMARQTIEREKLFVRMDVFEAVQQADGIQARGIEGEVHSLSKRMDNVATHTEVKKLEDRMTRTEDQRRTDRNLLLASLAFPLLLLLVGALITSGSLG